MQNWKIKRMSYKRINEWLGAIDLLLDDYEGKKPCRGCPLCDFADKEDCKKCLWEIIEREDCYDFARRNDFGHAPKRHEKRWQMLRIPMLRQWKKILKAELARRDL